MAKTCTSLINCVEEKRTLFQKKGYTIKQCNQCGHRFTELLSTEEHTAKVFSDDYFFKGKDGYPNYLDEKDLLIKTGRQYAKIVSKYSVPGRVFSVGCAAGFVLKGFQISGWDAYGVEPNDTMASYGRKEMELDITTGSFETFTTDKKFDLLSVVEVIGSFYDLDKAMENAFKLLNSGGLVLVESWDMKSFVARFFGKSWHEYCPPSVIHWYSDKTLTQLFNYYGFDFVAKGRPAKRIKMNHALSILETNLPKFFFKKKLISVASRMFGKLSVRYPSFDLKWYIFKKR